MCAYFDSMIFGGVVCGGQLREEYEQQLAGVEVQLSLVAGRQADEAKAVLTLVKRCNFCCCITVYICMVSIFVS